MKCPNCGAEEKTLVKICATCGEAYTSQDLLELYQLQFMVDEIADWDMPEYLREGYSQRLETLRQRLTHHLAPAMQTATVAVPAAIPAPEPVMPPPQPVAPPAPVAATVTAVPAKAPVAAAPPTPPKEKVPFDQWLLSERNIKLALYSGGALLVLSGLIFVGVNWARIPGPAKFAITLMITGLMYLGGYLLFQRPALRLGGVALLGVASGFVPLNFLVLQTYIFGPRGLNPQVTWLAGSLVCLLLYLLTAYWARADLFTYISVVALVSGLTAALALLEAPQLVFALAYALLALLLLLGARLLQHTRLAEFTRLPLLIVAQLAMPVLFIYGAVISMSDTGCVVCPNGSPWLGLTTMLVGVAFYIVTDLVIGWLAGRWVAAFAFAITFLCLLIQLHFSSTQIALSLMALALGYLLGGRAVEGRAGKRSAAWPLYAAGYAAAGLVTLQALLNVVPAPDDVAKVLLADVVLLAVSAWTHRQPGWAYAAAWLFIAPVYIYANLYIKGLDNQGLVMTLLGLAYLLGGNALERRVGKRSAGWPVYAAGYFAAVIVTLRALFNMFSAPDDLAKILLADVVLLAVSAWVHRQYGWVYAAAWLFMAPVYIFTSLYVSSLSNQGLIMAVLMLNYVVAGYVLGRRSLWLGGPFLSSAVLLSVLVVALTWSNPAVASLALVSIAVLYLFAALWRKWSWLLLPALAAVNLAVVAILRIFFKADSPWASTLTVTYAILGMALIVGGALLRRARQAPWGWPLYLVGVLDAGLAYLSGLYLLNAPTVIAFSVALAALAFWLTWEERALFAKLPPLLAYLGVAFIFIGHFYMLGLSSRALETWPPYTAGLCALFVALTWLLRRKPLRDLYGTPLHWAGLCLMVLPLAGAIYLADPMLAAVTFAIAGITYAADAAMRRVLRLGYLAGGAFIIVIWALLLYFKVTELQAFVMPLGMGLLALGWTEHRMGRRASFRWPTLLGLLILMGSAFYQSLDEVGYAVLLLVESLAAVAWGVRVHCRGYVQVGVLALIANGIAQLGPGFVELTRWVQLGIIGVILLGGGLIALFRRDQLLVTRKRLTEDWRHWEP